MREPVLMRGKRMPIAHRSVGRLIASTTSEPKRGYSPTSRSSIPADRSAWIGFIASTGAGDSSRKQSHAGPLRCIYTVRITGAPVGWFRPALILRRARRQLPRGQIAKVINRRIPPLPVRGARQNGWINYQRGIGLPFALSNQPTLAAIERKPANACVILILFCSMRKVTLLN
jgi:hypothetical protein